MDGLLHNWEASLHGGRSKELSSELWVPPMGSDLKFNVDGAARGKPWLAAGVEVLRNGKGVVLFIFSKNVVNMESNEAEVVATLEDLRFFSLASFQASLIVESDCPNIVWTGL